VHQFGRRLRSGVVNHRLQRVIVDHHQISGVLSYIAVLGHHQGHRIADETYLVLCQGGTGSLRAVRPQQGVPLLVHARIDIRGDEHRCYPR
jgi:hypothetical protein